MRTCHTGYARTVATIAGLASFVLFLAQVATAAKVGYPNPRPNSAIRLVGGNRTFTFKDDGSNPAGTTYELFVSEYDPDNPSDRDWASQGTFTKTTPLGEEETFSWNSSTATVNRMIPWPYNDPTLPDPLGDPYTGLRGNISYVWRVDVNGSTGDEWIVHIPMIQPMHSATRVGVYVRFVWDAHPYLSAGQVQEKLLLVDYDEGSSSYTKSWVTRDSSGNITGINTDRVVKTYNPLNTPYGHPNVREFWYKDSGYVRLLPNRRYRFRIVYCDKDGNPLFDDADDNNTRNQNGSEPFLWADGHNDDWHGWEIRTVPEISSVTDSNCESVIIYYESMYGTLPRDPEENDYSFQGVASHIEYIHESVHHPAISTRIYGTEEITASYGGLHNDSSQRASCTAQPEWVPEITQFPGWYTMTRAQRADAGFPPEYTYEYDAQDKYEEWTARAIRTFLLDAANGWGFGADDDKARLENLQYVILVGDADRVAPSFWYYYPIARFGSTENRWLPTDFFYTSQNGTSEVKTTPHYQVSRIPLRAKYYYRTVDRTGTTYEPYEPVVDKINDYATVLNSDAKKSTAYQNWFGRAVMVAAATEYDAWHQFFPGFVQELISSRVFTGGSTYRDTFSGIKVLAYNIWGSTSSERLTSSNILKHLINPTDATEVPGFVYLLGQGSNWSSSTYGRDFWYTPVSRIRDTDFPVLYDGDVTDGRRPLVISCAGLINRFDNAIWGNDTYRSLGEAAVLAQGGPISVIGFHSADYQITVDYTARYPDGTSDVFTVSDVFGTSLDDREGHTYPVLENGVLALKNDGNAETAVHGKVELVQRIAKRYQTTTQPRIGGIFNQALAEYVTAHQTEFTTATHAVNKRVTTTIFGASILGDSALVMPQRQRPAADNARPVVSDTNPRPAASISGYGTMPRYNNSNMPVHVIPHYTATNNGVNVELEIQTDAPSVRVRVLTPFRMNTSYTPGYWYDTSGEHWSRTDPDADGDGDPETNPTVGGRCTYTFTVYTPSVYLVVVQAQNPKWTTSDGPLWRWLTERWIYIQAVNEFVRDTENNVLVVDMDQPDRYYLNGHRTEYDDVEDYYVNPNREGAGYEIGAEDPRNFIALYGLIANPVFPILNKEMGEDLGRDPPFRYHFWCTNVYHTLAANGDALKAGQLYHGDLTPDVLKSFQDSYGTVVVFTGDSLWSQFDYVRHGPHRYLYRYQSMGYNEVKSLQKYLDNGGDLFLSNQTIVDETAGTIPYMETFEEEYLGALTRTRDTDLTNMDGLIAGTLSEMIADVNIAGGDGHNNATRTGEVDPNGTESATIFTWDETSGPGTVVGTKSSAIQNRLLTNGARTIFFTWPFEAIDNLGIVGAGESGRVNIMRLIVEWLRNVPKAEPVNPLDGAAGVSRSVVLQWTRVPEAAYYRIYIGKASDGNPTGPGTIVTRDNPYFDPANPEDPGDPRLAPNTRYFWRVDCVNPDLSSVTEGDVWSFTTVSTALKVTSPDPIDGQTQVPVTQTFSWSNPNPGETTFDIYIWPSTVGGPTFDPTGGGAGIISGTNLTATSFTPSSALAPKTTYYWRVYSKNELCNPPPDGLGLSPTQGDTWSFSTITEPPKPTGPNPADGATNVITTVLLTWNATERTDSYDVFVWKDGTPAPGTDDVPSGLGGNTTSNSWAPGNLDTSTVYHWQVRPRNVAGRQNTVDTWTFTTSSVKAPDRVTLLTPANGATSVSMRPTFTWTTVTTAATYNLHYGIGSVPTAPTVTGLTTGSYTPTTALTGGETYYWRVDSVASDGLTKTESLVWSFTVAVPGAAYNFSPANGATNVNPTVTLSWSGTGSSYDLYLGEGSLPSTPTASGLTTTSYKPSTPLTAGATYAWKVVSKFPDNSQVDGPTLTFTVRTEAGGGGGGGGGGGCFLATAALESNSSPAAGVVESNCTGDYVLAPERAEQLDRIRTLRDNFLARFEAGRAFAAWYYAIGPHAAHAIRGNEPAKSAVRSLLLDPLAEIARSGAE